MLLMKVSEARSEPSQAYKMRILSKIVNVLKLILKLIWWGGGGGGLIRGHEGSTCLDTSISDTSDPTDLKTKDSPFVLYLLITWIVTHWIQGNSRILSITPITWISPFPFISCFDQFCLYFPKSNVDGIPA